VLSLGHARSAGISLFQPLIDRPKIFHNEGCNGCGAIGYGAQFVDLDGAVSVYQNTTPTPSHLLDTLLFSNEAALDRFAAGEDREKLRTINRKLAEMSAQRESGVNFATTADRQQGLVNEQIQLEKIVLPRMRKSVGEAQLLVPTAIGANFDVSPRQRWDEGGARSWSRRPPLLTAPRSTPREGSVRQRPF
jgi:hypothetical protein